MIYIGSNSLTTYNLTDPRQGSLIDNADISYMTRIEIQGGGIIDETALGGELVGTKTGTAAILRPGHFRPGTSSIRRWPCAISDTNLNDFSDAGVFAHPMSANALVRLVGPTGASSPARATGTMIRGEGVDAVHVQRHDLQHSTASHANSESVNDTVGPSPETPRAAQQHVL